jgi:hypothetical protein
MYRRLLLAAVLISILATTVVGRARAYESWCFDDPVVDINGHPVTIAVGVSGTPTVIDTTVQRAEVRIVVPKGVRVKTVGKTHMYFAETVRVIQTATPWQPGTAVPVRVEVSFTSKADLPAMMTITPDGKASQSVTGSTSTGLVAEFTIE